MSAPEKTASRQPGSGPGQRPGTRPAGMIAVGWPGVRRTRRAAQWGKKTYAGSLAADVWRRLDAMDVINRGMVFAATLLLCLFPFLIVVSALAGRPAAQSLTRYTGLNSQAAADIGHLFASPAATTSAVAGTASMVFFVFGGIAAAAALQQIYEQAFDLPHRRIKDLPHRLAWLAVLIAASLLSWLGRAPAPARRRPGAARRRRPGLGHRLLVAHHADLASGQDLLAGPVPSRLRHRRAVRGHADGLLAGLLRHGDLRRAHLWADRDHLRAAVLPDRHRRRGDPRRGRRPRLARALTRHERDRPITPLPAVLSCHCMRVSRGRGTAICRSPSISGRQSRARRRTALRPRRGSWRWLRGEPAAQ